MGKTMDEKTHIALSLVESSLVERERERERFESSSNQSSSAAAVVF
jgi:hypothetical protein